MVNLSRLISLPVISIYEVTFEGIVENVLINTTTKKVEWLVIYDEENDLKKVISFNKIYTINDSGISIKNSSCIHLYESVELQLSSSFNPINSYVFSLNDENLGKVKDVQINNGRLENLVLENNLIPCSMLLSFNNKVTVVKQKINQRLSNFQKKKVSFLKIDDQTTEYKVNILDNEEEQIYIPKKAVVNYNFLINRITTKDILTSSGEVIAKKDSIITLNLIDIVRKNGKLKELTLFSK